MKKFLVIALALLLAIAGAAQNTYRDATSGFLKEATLVASTAETGAFNSSVIDVGPYNSGTIYVYASSKTGTSPTLDVNFQSCASTTTTDCITHTSMTQITDNGSQLIKVTNFGRYIRVSGSIGGSNSPGYTVVIKAAFKPGAQQ